MYNSLSQNLGFKKWIVFSRQNYQILGQKGYFELQLLFNSAIETVANRIIELTPNGIIDKMMEYDEYITSDHIKEMRARMYGDN